MVGVLATPALLAAVPRLGGQVVQQPPLVAGGVLDHVSQPPAWPQPLGLHIPALQLPVRPAPACPAACSGLHSVMHRRLCVQGPLHLTRLKLLEKDAGVGPVCAAVLELRVELCRDS